MLNGKGKKFTKGSGDKFKNERGGCKWQKGGVKFSKEGKVAPTLGPVHDISNDQGKTGPHTRPSPRHF